MILNLRAVTGWLMSEDQTPSSDLSVIQEIGVWRQALNQKRFELMVMIVVNLALIISYLILSSKVEASTIWVDEANYPGYNGRSEPSWPNGRFKFISP
jgi:hypothetical protein